MNELQIKKGKRIHVYISNLTFLEFTDYQHVLAWHRQTSSLNSILYQNTGNYTHA